MKGHNIAFNTSIFKNNDCFDENSKYNRDDFLRYIIELRKVFLENNLALNTKDLVRNIDENTFILQLGLRVEKIKSKNNYLILQESPHFDKGLIDNSNHHYYKKIFTWNDDMVDNKKYFKVNYSYEIPKTIPRNFNNKKLCCVIAGNKTAVHPDELYTKRVDFIRWFEKNHLEEFDLFGTQWDEYRFGKSLLGRALNKIKLLRKSTFKSYKGKVDSKFETMRKYKFSICYENIKDQNGYITEKIFDSFFAGCVPIYWGAKNITTHIPKECFIDKRQFNSYEEIYNYIKNMDEETYIGYVEAIEKFLNSSKADKFRTEIFADTIVSEILKDIK